MNLETREHGAEPEDGTFVDSYLLYLLAAASEKASGEFHAHVRRSGLRVPEWRVMACLFDNDHRMITELADLSLMEQSRMTRIVEQMQSKGLLSRAPDPEDRRRVRVSLTERGRDIAEGLVADARAHEATLLSALADTDASRIKLVLKALLERLDAQ